METLSYGAFSASLHKQAIVDRLPLNGTIEITRRCPLTCAHCYNNLAMGDRAAQLAELATDEHRKLLDDLADEGCLWLLYTGGEIFARRDFLDIYRHAKSAGFLVTLFTNGILIDERVADQLREWRPFAIEITLYGRTRETYERLTGVPGSFDRCMRAIDLLLARGLPLKLKTVAVTINQHEVRDMQQFARGLGVEFKFDAMMNPRIDCSLSPLAVRLSPEDCVALDLDDPAVVAEWKLFASRFHGPVHSEATADQLYHCGGGVDSFAISPEGKMSICVLSQHDTYDLRTGSVREAWRHFLRAIRTERRVSRPTKCTACHLKALCGMCPANGELENGDPEAPVDFLCQVAHLRAHAFGLTVEPHGACEYCEGGAGYSAIVESAGRLHARVPALSRATPTFLPIHESPGGASACTPGGCSSCRS